MRSERIKKVLENLKKSGLSQLLISDPTAILYLTGYKFHAGERLLLLHLGKNGATLYLNELSQKTEPIDGVETIRFTLGDDGLSRVIARLDKTGVLGVDKKLAASYLVPILKRTGLEIALGSEAVDRTRARKDSTEQELMTKSSEINDLAMARFEELIVEGVTENEVKERLKPIYLELGADDIAFGIVAFGKNAAEPHHSVDDTRLRAGDAVLFDIGCVYKGYISDMTRTFFYKGVSEHQREVYETVRRANEAAEALIRPGVRFSALDAAARDLIAAAGYGEYFVHRLGHSIGLEVHEPGEVSAYNDDEAQPGMIFSIEPGIYLPGDVGVRIEDLVLVTENGYINLNKHPKELKILG